MIKEFFMTIEEKLKTYKLNKINLGFKLGLPVYMKLFYKSETEKEIEERNDIYIYNTLRYPPKSTPPTTN